MEMKEETENKEKEETENKEKEDTENKEKGIQKTEKRRRGNGVTVSRSEEERRKKRRPPSQQPSPFLSVYSKKYSGRSFPSFKQPLELGQLTADSSRQWHIGDPLQLLRRYKIPQLKCDLNRGYERWIKRDESQEEHLDAILKWLSESQRSSLPKDLDIICWRGILTKVVCAPYCRESWVLQVVKQQGVYYLDEVQTEELKKRKEEMENDARQRLMCYWGYSFEQYCTTENCERDSKEEKEEGKKEEEEPVNTNLAYCSVLTTQLCGHSILMCGEVDCYVGSTENKRPPANYVELKTSKLIQTEKDQYIFERHKLLKMWAQSFLAGVQTVVVGFRDAEGIVQKIETLDTLKIPQLVKKTQWDPSVCLHFLNEFFKWVKAFIQKENTVYTVHFIDPFTHVAIQEEGSETATFLPSWYSSTVQNVSEKIRV